jgi:hypothetical protein
MNSSCDLHALSFQIVKSSNGHVTFAVDEVEVKQVLPRMDADNDGVVFMQDFGNVRRAIRQGGEERWVEQREKPRRCETNSTTNEVSQRGFDK